MTLLGSAWPVLLAIAMVIAAAAVVGALVTHWLVEPANSFGSDLAVDELEAVLAEEELRAVAAG